MASEFITNGRSFLCANGGIRNCWEDVQQHAGFMADARNSFGYSSFDKSSSAPGIGMVAVTVVPP
jgi:hypothetical protein